MRAPSWPRKLSDALGLRPEGQDWGIENADPDRIGAFVAFYEANVPDHPWEPEALAELVFASADEAITARDLAAPERAVVVQLVAEHGAEFPVTLSYWEALPPDAFPASDLVREGAALGAARPPSP